MTRPGSHRHVRAPSLVDAPVPQVALVVLIGGSLALFGLDALDGPIQVALVLCAMIAALVVLKNGHRWDEVQAASQRALTSITSAVFILLAVGALIGAWNLSGTIPTLVYYGLQVLAPTWYYAATALICGIVAMSIGSSWTTSGTIGVGLVGIALMLGLSPGITAGAVISGAYLGDKLSPLSETTVLTAQLAQVDVYQHIKRQAWTSLPAFGLAFILFGLIGLFWGPAPTDATDTASELTALGDIYWISPLNLLPLALLALFVAGPVAASQPSDALIGEVPKETKLLVGVDVDKVSKSFLFDELMKLLQEQKLGTSILSFALESGSFDFEKDVDAMLIAFERPMMNPQAKSTPPRPRASSTR